MENTTLLQAFQWELPADHSHWRKLQEMAEEFAFLGITGLWVPPASKGAAGAQDVGYGTYDLYDLGEFDQKGTIPTKYGTKAEYIQMIEKMHATGLQVYGDIVFNHFMGADETEDVPAIKYSWENRQEAISEEELISAWTKFTFPGRAGRYNDYHWHWQNFSGVDYDARRKDHGIFNFAGKGWEQDVDSENGNYDYLMGCDLDMENPETIEQLDRWGQWFLEKTQVDGFRLDAVKHIDFQYYIDWLLHRREEKGAPLFVVGEYWADDVEKLAHYLDTSGNLISLFDVPLHFNFFEASSSMGGFDMRKIFDNTLLASRPDYAVTFVDNHDTQKGQSLESWVEGWFKVQAYALILLRKEGIPTVFWGDLYGIPTQDVDPVGPELVTLLLLRKHLAYGKQVDYFEHEDRIGWTRTGDFDHPLSGYAVVMTNATGGSVAMTISAMHGGKTFVDAMGNQQEKVVLDKEGSGVFPVGDGQIAVYVNEEILPIIQEAQSHLADL